MILIKAVAVASAVTLGVGGLVATVVRPDRGETVVIPAGTTFMAVMEEDLPTGKLAEGDEFELRTIRPVRLNGGMEIPVGSQITGEVTDYDDEAMGEDEDIGPARISVRFTELVLEGDSTEIEIQTEQFRFGTLAQRASDVPVVVPAGKRLSIRLTRPVSVAYRPAPEPIHAAE